MRHASALAGPSAYFGPSLTAKAHTMSDVCTRLAHAIWIVAACTNRAWKVSFVCVCLVFVGCGGGNADTSSGSTPAPISSGPSFAISLSPANTTLAQGGTSEVQVSVMPQNGFTGSVSVTTGSLPSGVMISPTTLSITPGSSAGFTFSASTIAGITQQSISVNGSSASLAASASLQLTITGAAVADPYHPIGGSMVHGFYDESRELLFATNFGLNELDVISGAGFLCQGTRAGSATSWNRPNGRWKDPRNWHGGAGDRHG